MAMMTIRQVEGEAEARACAEIMATTDPWLRYGRSRDNTFGTVTYPNAESYAAIGDEGEVLGVVILILRVPLIRGYVMGLAVKESHRGRGIGTKLLKHAEERIFSESPNAFICATSFNTGARRLYERLGYQHVGDITNFVLPDVHEHLLRKTLGPQSTFKPAT